MNENKIQTVVFLGAKEIGANCLEYLVQNESKLGIKISGVITNSRGTALKEVAERTGLSVWADLEDFERRDNCDYLISVQYHEILRRRHIEKAKLLAINLHMAPLPEYRGCNQFSFAILNGDQEFGTTLHVLDEGVDTGDILFERRFPISSDCMVQELFQQTERESFTLFKDAIPRILSGDYVRKEQSQCENAERREFHRRSEIEALKEISLDWSANKIIRHLRATSMPGFSPPFAQVGGMKVEFHIEKR